jgi:histidinol-phosphatase (PHP family)
MHDYHTHNHFCRHATGGIEDFARRAIELGFDEICCTPHIPIPGFWPGFHEDKLRMDEEEFPRYLEELEEARAKLPGITILSGIEADYIEGQEEFLTRFLSSHSFDFVLMSIHNIGKWPRGQWTFDYSADPRPIESVYDDYFDAMEAGIRTGLYDCVAHLDLIKAPGHPVMATHRDRVRQIIDLCLERGMSAEVNTSGTRKAIGETYPSEGIVRLMVSRGLPVVPGSDSHTPAHVGFGFEKLAGLGAVDFARYRGRRIVGTTKAGRLATA